MRNLKALSLIFAGITSLQRVSARIDLNNPDLKDLIVKFLTKSAAYKAVDIFNDIAVKKIIDIFSGSSCIEYCRVRFICKIVDYGD